MRLNGRRAGFTLLEVVFTVALLAIGALMLSASLASSQRMQALARERETASNAIRAYLERMREKYPTTSSSADMTGFMIDTTTPLNFINTTSRYETGILRNPAATVQRANYESTMVWGPSNTSNATLAPVTSTMTAEDQAKLGLPRQLDTTAGNSDPVAHDDICYIPVKIELTWASGVNDSQNSLTQRQRMTVYAVIGNQH